MADTASTNIAQLALRDKLKLTFEKTLPKLPAAAAEQFKALLDPEALAIVAGIVILWAGLHFTGIGEIADVILIVTAWATVGAVAWQAGNQLMAFARGVNGAKSDADLDEAADHLARAISMIGIQALLTLLLHTAPKPYAHKPPEITKGWWNFGPAPRSPGGKWFYEPSTTTVPPSRLRGGAIGETSIWGDIKIASGLSRSDYRATLFHELMHRFLTPKLYPLRELRAQIRIQGYARSVILRYLEEAMAETYAQLRTRGLDMNAFLEGVRFPIGPDYEISLAGAVKEVKGVLLGPINVGGMVWNVWLAPGQQ
jgi:hypothetical protein